MYGPPQLKNRVGMYENCVQGEEQVKSEKEVKKWVIVPLKYVGRLMAMIQLIPNVRQVFVRELNSYTACHIVISMCMDKLCKSGGKWWLLLQLWTG